MTYLETYTSSLNNSSLSDSITTTAKSVVSNIESRFDFTEPLTGLLLGNVQSGKTGQMLGVISHLADKGYRIFLLLTTDNIDLQRQTYNRVKSVLTSFTVLSESDVVLFNPHNLIKPIVIVLKKNASVLRKWGNLLMTYQLNTGLCLTITISIIVQTRKFEKTTVIFYICGSGMHF